MKILYAASEANPFAKSGGLADVAGALPKALVKDGVDARVIATPRPRIAHTATTHSSPQRSILLIRSYFPAPMFALMDDSVD